MELLLAPASKVLNNWFEVTFKFSCAITIYFLNVKVIMFVSEVGPRINLEQVSRFSATDH